MKFLFLLLAVGLPVLAAAPATARPRDNVMSSTFRCAVIGDTKTWLDCYYGAAQPVRQALGMSPAPPAQVQLVTAPPAGTVSAADAALRDDVLAQAFGCRAITDDRQWLSCYYGAAAPARARLGLASSGQRLPAPLPPVPVPMASGPATPFGVRATRAEIPDSADHLTAKMVSYVFDAHGLFTVTLDDGHIWRELEGDQPLAKWAKPAPTYTVRISHGFMDSYNLQVVGRPGLYKVRRVK